MRPRDGPDGGNSLLRRHLSSPGQGQNVYPYALLGTFAPYVVVHQTSLVNIGPATPFEIAALVSCGVTTGFGSATRTAEVRPGDDVVVVGIGGVSTAAVLGAVHCGAHRVFAFDPVEWNRDQAVNFGATHAYPDIDTALTAVAEITGGRWRGAISGVSSVIPTPTGRAKVDTFVQSTIDPAKKGRPELI